MIHFAWSVSFRNCTFIIGCWRNLTNQNVVSGANTMTKNLSQHIQGHEYLWQIMVFEIVHIFVWNPIVFGTIWSTLYLFSSYYVILNINLWKFFPHKTMCSPSNWQWINCFKEDRCNFLAFNSILFFQRFSSNSLNNSNDVCGWHQPPGTRRPESVNLLPRTG